MEVLCRLNGIEVAAAAFMPNDRGSDEEMDTASNIPTREELAEITRRFS